MRSVPPPRQLLGEPGRVVIKIGSSLLVDAQSGRLRESWLAGLASDIAQLKQANVDVVVVSSGAVALGRRRCGLAGRSLGLDESQAAAALGQVALVESYQRVFAHHDLDVAQVLLTFYDTENRRRYLNARRTLSGLLTLGAIPVINENDTVATEELRYGDNDRLAARVAQMIDARLLVLLSDVDGLYDADPSRHADARLVPCVETITADVDAMAGGAGSDVGTGGMRTKLQAARIAVAAGCAVVITDGRAASPLNALKDGARHTWFAPSGTPGSARKRWIAGSLKPAGAVHVDDGAARALESGKSLLCVGVTGIEGDFERGDAVRVVNGLRTLAVGLSAYDCADARRLIGAAGDTIAQRLGYAGRPEMIHRDDLVLSADVPGPTLAT